MTQNNMLVWFVTLALVVGVTNGARVIEGTVRLKGGQAAGTGNVLVFHNGRWGGICDDGWGRNSADVVCRMLGFPRALAQTMASYFGNVKRFWLDDVRCSGTETSISQCQSGVWGQHDCDDREAAGVFCDSSNYSVPIPTVIEALPGREHSTEADVTATPKPPKEKQRRNGRKKIPRYNIRLVNGRSAKEGRVEIKIKGRWGTICADHWTMLEATVACKHAGQGYAQSAMPTSFFGGEDVDKLVMGVHCDGTEDKLWKCFHEETRNVLCPKGELVAGVTCTNALPDLMPNATLIQTSSYLQDLPMYYLQCAMEENCAAPSAFRIQSTSRDWHVHSRRLLRFSSSTWNIGTADFLPEQRKEDWEWHLCHMHYHSMHVFAHYDLVDQHGNRAAEGHKASFCLEDVQCKPGVPKKYICKGFGDQGISPGCADDYLHDIDCQWIDITDVSPGSYMFKVVINPQFLVAELNYSNNAVVCNMDYTGIAINMYNCYNTKG